MIVHAWDIETRIYHMTKGEDGDPWASPDQNPVPHPHNL